jgi:hypothetical protein
MQINFFDDPLESPKSREDVRIKKLGLYIHEDRRRVAVGFDITPFLERPSIEVIIANENGIRASSLHVIETIERNFSVTMHLRDENPTETYEIRVAVYYATPETDRVDVHVLTRTLDMKKSGEQ